METIKLEPLEYDRGDYELLEELNMGDYEPPRKVLSANGNLLKLASKIKKAVLPAPAGSVCRLCCLSTHLTRSVDTPVIIDFLKLVPSLVSSAATPLEARFIEFLF